MTKKVLKGIILSLLLVTLFAACFAVGASGEKIIQTAARITHANVVLNGKLELAFSVTPTIVMPKEGVAGIMVWSSDVTEPEIKNCEYVNFNEKNHKGNLYFKTLEIDAKDYATEFYVAACYKLGEEIHMAERPFKYSPARYLIKRMSDGASADQAKIYSTLLGFCLDANGGEADFSAIKAVGGYVGTLRSDIGGAYGQEVLLRADAKNAEGEYFLGWADESGVIVSGERLFTVKNESEGITTYTAIYGAAEESAYFATYDFEQLEDGYIKFNVPSQYTNYTNKGYNSAKTPVWRVASSGLPDLSIGYYVEAVNVGPNQYVYGGTDKFEVQNTNGDKELYIYRGHSIIGNSVVFSNTFENSFAYGGEVDIQFNTLLLSGVGHHVNVTIKDADGTALSLRTNLSYSTSSGNMSFYAEPDSGATRYTAEENISLKAGEILTVRLELDRENLALKLYASGKYLDSLPLSSYAGFAKVAETLDVSTSYVTSLGVYAISSAKDHMTVDNVVFLKGEEIILPEEGETPDEGVEDEEAIG